MKSKYTMLILMCLLMSGPTEAQILKKWKDKVANKILGIDNQSSKSDTLAANNMVDSLSMPPDNNIELPISYQFSYQTTMQLTNSQGTTNIEYYLQPNEMYFAKKQLVDSITVHVVYDNQRYMEVSFFELDNSKRKARSKMDLFTKAKMVGAYRDSHNREVKPIGTKTLLGYTCEGYEIATDAGITNIWVTNEAPATMFSSLFSQYAKETNSPFTKNTMLMESSFTSALNPEDNYHIKFTQLQPNTLVFNTTEYHQ